VSVFISHKKVRDAGAVPLADQLLEGELAVNVADGSVFTKLESGEVMKVGGEMVSAQSGNSIDTLAGTWTPTIKGDTTNPTVTYDAKGTKGRYVKIGSIVQVSCQVTLTAKSSGSGYVYIAGLPFPPANISAIGIANFSGWTTYGPTWANITTASRIVFRRPTTVSSLEQTALLTCDNLSATTKVFLSGSYITNATEPAS
jgi:hypothetical protein